MHTQARQAEALTRVPLQNAERAAQSLETEAQTLAKLLNAETGGAWPAVVEEITVAKGYEAAVGAAFGDDLDASTDVAAPAHWALTRSTDDPALPDNVAPLAAHVTAPTALARRLAQIGVVAKSEGKALQALLRPGQSLVSIEGDLWRWDGFTLAEEAPTLAARRLAQKNRLGDLTREAEAARKATEEVKAAAERAQADLRLKAEAETKARQYHRDALRQVEAARERAAAAERKNAQVAARLSAREEAEQRLTASRDEARDNHAKAQEALASLVAASELSVKLEMARAGATQDRAAATEARAALQAHLHETQMRAKRIQAIADERTSWQTRRERALSQIGEFESRIAEAAAEQAKLADAPNEFLRVRREPDEQDRCRGGGAPQSRRCPRRGRTTPRRSRQAGARGARRYEHCARGKGPQRGAP